MTPRTLETLPQASRRAAADQLFARTLGTLTGAELAALLGGNGRNRRLRAPLVRAEIASAAGGAARLKIGDREEVVTIKPGGRYSWK